MSQYRTSAPNLAYLDDTGPSRWDRDKFERERYSRRSGPDDREFVRFEERDRSTPDRSRRDLEVEIREERRPSAPRARFEERDRYFEEDRFERRRPAFLDEPTPEEIASRALAPYRRRATMDRDFDPLPVRRPQRPQYIRRQSSLDTFDRRPLPRYDDEYRIPADVSVPLPIRRPASPPRQRYREREFEEIKYKDLNDTHVDEYEDIRIKRERSRRRSSRPAASIRSSSTGSTSSFEKVDKTSVAVSVKEERGRRGKTRMPKRLADKKAVIDLGYSFEEEEDFIIIRRALGKEHIDEIIEMSKKIRSGETKTIYKYEERVENHAPLHSLPPPPLPPLHSLPPPPLPPPAFAPPAEHVVEEVRKTTFIDAPPPPPSAFRPPSPARSQFSHAPSHHHHHHASHRPHEFVEERIDESASIGGPLTILMPERNHGRDPRHEIASLEAERRALKLERETDEQRTLVLRDDYEVIDRVERDRPREREREREVIRVEKDRKGRSRSRPPNPKLVALAMATLT